MECTLACPLSKKTIHGVNIAIVECAEMMIERETLPYVYVLRSLSMVIQL